MFVAGYTPARSDLAVLPERRCFAAGHAHLVRRGSIVPFAGGQIGCSSACPRGRTVSATAFMSTWGVRNGCTGGPTSSPINAQIGGQGSHRVWACAKLTVQDLLHDTNHEYYGGSLSAEQTYKAANTSWTFLKQLLHALSLCRRPGHGWPGTRKSLEIPQLVRLGGEVVHGLAVRV